MPGGAGRLVVLDRSGRAGRQFQLSEGAATIGKASGCDVRVLQPSVASHHATLVVHNNQTVIRNVGDGETLVNGKAVSVAALQHEDVITVGDRCLRWQYDAPPSRSPLKLPELPYAPARGTRAPRPAPRRATAAAPADAQPHIRKTLEMQHRASMPGSAGGKQVAIVQPQRRDTSSEHTESSQPRSPHRARSSRSDADLHNASSPPRSPPRSPRHSLKPHSAAPNISLSTCKKVSTPKPCPSLLQTKATLWIESRKSSPRKGVQSAVTPSRVVPKRAAASAKKSTPLRLAVLRRAQSAHKAKVTKIEAPLKIDAMKQAALMLMTGHSRRASGQGSAPALALPRRSPALRPHGAAKRKSKRGSGGPRGSRGARGARGSKGNSVSVLEITDTDTSLHSSSEPGLSARSRAGLASPLLPSPRKSALKDPNRSRKNESIKFDLSNLESYSQGDDVLMVSARSRGRRGAAGSGDLTLHYSDASTVRSASRSPSASPASPGPSPRRSIHSRASKMLQQVGSPMKDSRTSGFRDATLTPESPRARKSLRGSVMVQKALGASRDASTYSRRSTKTLTDQSLDSTAESAFRTRTLSPRSRNMESYSIVDLVSMDSDESGTSASVYDSVGSTRSSSVLFGTPQGASAPGPGRATRSTIDPKALTSSTPYGGGRASARAHSSPSARRGAPGAARPAAPTRRSQSLTTPENSEETQKHISINSTRLSRASRSRSRINDSDLFLNSSIADSESPKTSRRSAKADKSGLHSSSPKISRITASRNNSRASQASGRKSTLQSSFADSVSQLSPRRSASQSSPTNESLVSATSASHASPRRSAQITSRSISQVSSRGNSKSPNKSPNAKVSLKKSIPLKTPGKSPSPRRSTARSSPSKSPSIASTSRSRSSRSVLTLDASHTSEDGVVTPENRNSPPDAGTPVLSIQSLLDSSQSSFSSQISLGNARGSVHIKRKTIGVLRSGRKARASPKSKSVTVSARKCLRSVGGGSALDLDESTAENVTPKSAVKLVQEAVKNKHSTAKKPQSKRSIIDNLNESDIVKQLFNSPVKRKLSQSMTEFSRNRLFDDDDVPRRRPARNTVALTGRTPDHSLLDNTDRYTPEQFVSPLSTPGNSPNLTGVKLLFAKNSPKNDLRNVKGVKKLARSPRTRKSVKNDLRNVSGVKAVFGKSPRNDLRRVTGVKSLFQSERKRKSPTNDLRDVRGVKKLFTRKSVTNDLGNVSGVKRTLRNHSPRNDLRDVRGLKRVFHEPRGDRSADLSGVEELFDISTVSSTSTRDPEALFDQLVGKPPIKAVYSKSFTATRPQRKKLRSNSLRKSIELITNNVDQWIEQELQRTLHKDMAHQSRKSNVSRELQKLATDTVTGTEIRPSRARSSILTKSTSEGARRSAAEMYSAHTLPIKKRSFVEASLEKSADVSAASRSHALPIKKRAVVHSTPVKGRGRHSVAMNASELGRVSPIAALDATRADPAEPSASNRSKHPNSPKQKPKRGTRGTRGNIIEESEIEIVEQFPTSPKQARRSTKARSDKTERSGVQAESPRRKTPGRAPTLTSANRSVAQSPMLSPKGRKTKASILNVSKQSVASPKSVRSKAKGETLNPKVVLTRMSPVVSSKASPKVGSPKAKGRRTKASVSAVTAEKSPKPKRGAATVSTTAVEVHPPTARRTRNNTEKQDSKESPRKGRGKKNVTQNEGSVLSPKKDQRRAVKAKTPQKTQKKAEPKPSPKKTRGSKATTSPVKPARSGRNKADATQVTNTKKRRKSLVITKKAPVMSPQPAARQARKVDTPKRAPRRKAAPAQSPKAKTPKATRARLVVAKPSPKLNPRGAKAARSASGSDNSRKGSAKKLVSPKRTRKNAPAGSPKKTKKAEPKKSAAKKAVEKSEPSPPAKRGRPQRADETEPATKRGRTRKNTAPARPPSPKKQTKKLTPKTQSPSKATSKKTRGKNVSQESLQAPKTNRRTNAKVEAAQEPPRGRGRKRKTTDDIPAGPAKVARGAAKAARGRNTGAEVRKPSPIKKVSPAKGKAKEVSPVKSRTRTASPVKGKSRVTSPAKGKSKRSTPIQGKAKAVPPAKGKAKAASPAKGKAKAASPPKGKATRNKKEDSAKLKREDSIILPARGKRQPASEMKTAGRAQRAAKDTTARGNPKTSAPAKNQAKVSTASASTNSRGAKGPASPAKVVKSTRSRRR